MELMIVSGRSGSGKTVALRALEDLGFYCVDNLPVAMVAQLVERLRGSFDKVAVSIDARNLSADTELSPLLTSLREQTRLTIIYLDAKDDALIRRFAETRRAHPLSRQTLPLPEAMAFEANLLSGLKERADLLIDSTNLSLHQLAMLVQERVTGNPLQQMLVVLESFGFKNGLPQDADFVLDARFLPNPYWRRELRPLTGRDLAVQQFFSQFPEVNKFIWQISNLVMTWMPLIEKSNRRYLTIAVGCTGGQHRSVFIVEALAAQFSEVGRPIQVRHRDMPTGESHG